MTTYNKLVRDKVPATIEANGDSYVAHRATDDEYAVKLREKLREEVDEFLAEPSVGELVDIVEVVYSIADLMGLSAAQFNEARDEKAESLGRFQDRIILEEA